MQRYCLALEEIGQGNEFVNMGSMEERMVHTKNDSLEEYYYWMNRIFEDGEIITETSEIQLWRYVN